jgi:hypothetical protein
MGLRASLSAPVQVEWLENKNPLMVLLLMRWARTPAGKCI